jgi:FkbM family methyltransferase
MSIFRRESPDSPALIPDVVEAFGLADRFQDKLLLVGTLTLHKLSGWGLPADPGRHEIRIRTAGFDLNLDIWSGEQRPLREIIGRDEYGIRRGDLIHAGSTVIDVGANIGVFSVLAARAVGKDGIVLAYEPHPAAFKRLAANARQNGLEGVLIPINAAVSDRRGEFQFHPSAVSVHNRVNRDSESTEALLATVVEAVALDEDPRVTALAKIDFMKVDVEGHEVQVLRGAQRTLERTSAVLLEYHRTDLKDAAIALLRSGGLTEMTERVYGPGLGLVKAHRA